MRLRVLQVGINSGELGDIYSANGIVVEELQVTLPYLALPYPTLRCLTLPCVRLTLPCLALPYLTLP